MTESPSEMLAEAKAGGSGELGRLLERHRGYLTLLARVRIGPQLQGKVDPADLVQETFLEAHRHFRSFQGRSPPEFTGWLRQILASQMANLLRRYLGTQARDVRLERELANDLDRSSMAMAQVLEGSQSTPSQQAVHREQALQLADALGQLPPDYREVIILRNLESLTFPQIAERMGRSVDSVEKLWLRGLARLRVSFGAIE